MLAGDCSDDDDALNQRVSEAAEARRIFCNVVDVPKPPA
ncbi:NAD(P)-dependent oxidoreductase [Shigella sonnei]